MSERTTEVPRYVAALAKLQEQGLIPATGVHRIDVVHDDWCGIHKGRRCMCNFHVKCDGVTIAKDWPRDKP